MEKVLIWLEQNNWSFEKIDSENIATGFHVNLPNGDSLGFPLYFMRIIDPFEEVYIRCVIAPYIDKPQAGYPDEVFRHIAKINHDLTQLKFALDGDDELELLIDIPQSQVTETNLETFIQLLVECAAAFYVELFQTLKI